MLRLHWGVKVQDEAVGLWGLGFRDQGLVGCPGLEVNLSFVSLWHKLSYSKS